MPKNQMLINYVPGEECRVAIVRDGKLEELHEERANNVSHVGDIYVGKVVNVEPSIQAAFIDFGLDNNGFLHISDLHPRYFPGGDDDRTERVGKKTPRRERPTIQQALKRGQEITVQVLKEGIGTKGPTLTSYLSVPGRYLVMMPDMDRVGVSRKVEDDEQRRKMRQMLEQLTLPEGFGFILRTAGMDRNKAELKRDLSYLSRLWKDMERRRRKGKKPRLLYAESDLLMRSLRDFLTSDIDEVVIDEVSAIKRANRFMKIVAPRSSTKLLHYDEAAPLFHAFRVEEQIARIHAREVPLPSGGSLVIDEAEALVAIDVNSGKMRSHGDAETTAFRTNQEAIEEICRQLRLRDLGGLVINDLIDMRSRSHQRQIENLFRNHLKRDRARTKILSVSQFGIIEMTRQRMKGSLRSAHFTSCPECGGRGVVQRPDSVANDAMRNLANLLQHDRVKKVEMVVSPRVASELLSKKRLRLGQLEHLTGKHVDVRVSETIPVDRLTFYAYDDRGSDIDVDRLPTPPIPKKLTEWDEKPSSTEEWSVSPTEEADLAAQQSMDLEPAAAAASDDLLIADEDELRAEDDEDSGKKRKRRRRGRRGGRGRRKGDDGAGEDRSEEKAPSRGEASTSDARDDEGEEEGGGRKKRRRRGRRGGRGRRKSSDAAASDQSGEETTETDRADEASERGGRSDSWDLEPEELPSTGSSAPDREQERDESPGDEKKGRKRSRRRGGRGRKKRSEGAEEQSVEAEAPNAESEGAETTLSADGPRGDSWDLDPEEVQPAKKPRSKQEKDRTEKPDIETAPAAGGARGDSWDLEPDEIQPPQETSKRDDSSDRDEESSSRGDSWDVEPTEVKATEPPKPRRGSKKKASRSKAETKEETPSVRKPKRSVRSRQSSAEDSGPPKIPAEAMPDNIHPVGAPSGGGPDSDGEEKASQSKKKSTRKKSSKKKTATASKKKSSKKSASKSSRKKSTGRKKAGGGSESAETVVESGANSE